MSINEKLEKKVSELESQLRSYQNQNKALEERALRSQQNYLNVNSKYSSITRFKLQREFEKSQSNYEGIRSEIEKKHSGFNKELERRAKEMVIY